MTAEQTYVIAGEGLAGAQAAQTLHHGRRERDVWVAPAVDRDSFADQPLELAPIEAT